MTEQQPTTLERIHQAARAEFREKGFPSASLRSIVKSLGMTTGAFYGYYPSKEALYEALAEDVLGKPISKLTEPYLQKTLAKFEDFLRGKGLGVPYEVLVESYDYYTQWKKIFKSIDHYPLENAENLLKSFEIEDTSASEKVEPASTPVATSPMIFLMTGFFACFSSVFRERISGRPALRRMAI